jgi:squalene-associated FAD-dependent desaturase
MAGHVHVIGAGLAGLSAAVDLAEAGWRVTVHEAAKFAGGRCRSFYDSTIGLVVDNGSHLLLSGNRCAMDYLERTGGLSAMSGTEHAEIPFADLATGERWTLRPNSSRVPWWIFDAKRRVPGSRARDYLAPVNLLRALPSAGRIGDVMDVNAPLYHRLWRPVLLAALNTEPSEADARMATQVFWETFGAGGKACRPLIALSGLSSAFVDPALAHLGRLGTEFRYAHVLRGLKIEHGRVAGLEFGEDRIALGPDDRVIMAVPAVVARAFVPGVTAPEKSHAIISVHFRIAPPPGQPMFLGVVNGITEWLFAYRDHLSVTISHADRLLDHPRKALAERVWGEVSALTGLAAELPAWQINRERRATFAATPTEAAKRPGVRTGLENLFLAGDWTATGLPASMEGAVRSGFAAATAVRGAEQRPTSRAA